LILLYCRPGFERDCAQEISARVAAMGGNATPRHEPGQGFVLVTIAADEPLPGELLDVSELVFSRQALELVAEAALGDRDRITPLVNAAVEAKVKADRLWLETPDTNEGKTLSAFTRRFAPLLEAALEEAGVLRKREPARRTLHVFFRDRASALVGTSEGALASPWPMGIPRLRMPSRAPSRSTLKLAEALHVFLGDRVAERMRAGTRAVDLGAAPGGWTWQLAQRGLRVTAVDNARLAPEVLATGLVEHVRGDAFHFEPRKRVAWMVCDVVEQPIRVAGLAADWIARDWCRECIVNLKLPMRKRFEEWERCRGEIEKRLRRAGTEYRILAKQLYHDREEITLYLARTA
jgi:23S rRNA (cytidine2498-2'-O)-methyltransferase